MSAGHHLVGPLNSAALHDRGVSVGRDRDIPPGSDDGADRRVGAQRAFDPRDDCLEGCIGDCLSRRIEDRRQAVAAEAAEVAFRELARLSRLRAARFPPGAGERGLDFRREQTEHDGHHQPGTHDKAEVRRRPAAEPAERTEREPLASGGRDGGRPLSTSDVSSASCDCRPPQTCSQSS